MSQIPAIPDEENGPAIRLRWLMFFRVIFATSLLATNIFIQFRQPDEVAPSLIEPEARRNSDTISMTYKVHRNAYPTTCHQLPAALMRGNPWVSGILGLYSGVGSGERPVSSVISAFSHSGAGKVQVWIPFEHLPSREELR